jgi:AcrR family transcriptional regulator
MSYEGAIVVDGVNYGRRLPRGKHGIPQELVIANQRERLLSAATAIIAEEGYSSLAVANVIERAGVSRGTFYKIFENKVDCVLAAQQRAIEGLIETILEAGTAERDWPTGVASAVGAALDFAVRFPGDTRLILASSHAPSEPRLSREGLAVHERLVELLRNGARHCPSARSPSEMTERAAVGAAMSIVDTGFAAGEVDDLPKLRPDLVQIILTPYLGGNEAKRIAQSA